MSESQTPPIARHIDARDLICPLPVLKARKALKGVELGQVVTIDTTDAAAESDFRAFCEATGHGLLAVEKLDDDVTRFTIERSST